LALFDAFEGVGHDVVMPSVDELRPDFADKGQEMLAGFAEIVAADQAFTGDGRKATELVYQNLEFVWDLIRSAHATRIYLGLLLVLN
jgi:hypothetical protein